MDPEYRERLEYAAELDRLRVENAELRRRLNRYEGLDQLRRLNDQQNIRLLDLQMARSQSSPLVGAGYASAFGGLLPW